MKPRSRYDYKKERCAYSSPGGWCNLPKYKRCENCIRCADGSKACEVEL